MFTFITSTLFDWLSFVLSIFFLLAIEQDTKDELAKDQNDVSTICEKMLKFQNPVSNITRYIDTYIDHLFNLIWIFFSEFGNIILSTVPYWSRIWRIWRGFDELA